MYENIKMIYTWDPCIVIETVSGRPYSSSLFFHLIQLILSFLFYALSHYLIISPLLLPLTLAQSMEARDDLPLLTCCHDRLQLYPSSLVASYPLGQRDEALVNQLQGNHVWESQKKKSIAQHYRGVAERQFFFSTLSVLLLLSINLLSLCLYSFLCHPLIFHALPFTSTHLLFLFCRASWSTEAIERVCTRMPMRGVSYSVQETTRFAKRRRKVGKGGTLVFYMNVICSLCIWGYVAGNMGLMVCLWMWKDRWIYLSSIRLEQ